MANVTETKVAHKKKDKLKQTRCNEYCINFFKILLKNFGWTDYTEKNKIRVSIGFLFNCVC